VAVILVFIGFVLVGDAAAVGIATLVERFSEPASLLVFFALFVLVFWIGWMLAVRGDRTLPDAQDLT
jgi:predicted tellurium resistance membrane protein TerC